MPEPNGVDVVCTHGVAMDVHCCNCHSGFLFDVESCRCRGLTMPEQSEDDEIVNALTRVVREADETFQRTGGGSRHWVRDCFLPLLNRAGWILAIYEPQTVGSGWEGAHLVNEEIIEIDEDGKVSGPPPIGPIREP